MQTKQVPLFKDWFNIEIVFMMTQQEFICD